MTDPSNTELDLPAGMFRTGSKTEEVTIQVPKKNFSEPVNRKTTFTEINGLAIFEGDILLGNADEIRGETDPGPRGIGIRGAQYRWPGGVVPYVISHESVRSRVQSAIAHWRSKTPIRFVERQQEHPDFISFQSLDGCYSSVGRRGGMQIISLGEGCSVGSAIHEIGHALGLWHEQSRSDRDQFITVILDNVAIHARNNFNKHIFDGQDLGAYDYASIMHYPAMAFSTNGKPTIVTKQAQQPIGQRNGLSPGDIAAIKALYPDLAWT
jgi:hypothetical protein